MKIGLSVFNRSASINASGGQSSYSTSRPMEAIKQVLKCIANILRQAFNTSKVNCESKSVPASVDEEPWNPREARFDFACPKVPKKPIRNKAESAPRSSSPTVSPSPLPKPVKLQHLHMPANPDYNTEHAFPFGVNYNLAKVPLASRLGVSVDTDQALKGALRDSILSRQGVFEWARQGGQGLHSQLESGLIARESVSLGHGVVVHGLESLKTSDGAHHYQMLVSAPAQDKDGEVDTFVVPVTELQIPKGKVIEKDWLRRSEKALQFHLSKVDLPYQDSVETPLVLSSGCNRLADMHVLQTEVSSRIQAGLVQSQNELTQTLRQLAPEFLPNNSGEATWQLGPVLQKELAHLRTPNGTAESGLLGVKRYFPNITDLGSESETESVVTLKSMLEPDSESVMEMDCVSELESPQDFEPDLDSAITASARPITHTVLTLADKVPFRQLNEFQAFRQAATHANHCGVAAVNGFFQAEVMNAVKAVNHIVKTYAQPYEPYELIDMNLPGLYHPALLGAMKQGQSIVMTRAQFVGGEGFADYRNYSGIYSANPEDQWDALCNYKFPGLAKPDRVEITPDLWLSAATGVHLDCLESMVNQFLESKGDNPIWSEYPEKVAKFAVGEDDVRAALERNIAQQILNREGDRAGNTLFPMICMTSGHYFAVARTESGNWVKLDSSNARGTGIQAPLPFTDSERTLEDALRFEGVIHVICEPLPLLKQPDSEAERR